jgi:DNA polymerase I-like protein with 3'-5' exonuclease and polymerase domains
MTIRILFITLFLSAIASTGFGQDREADSQTLREILTEIRGIHEEVRVTESTQILLTELEMQQSIVNRAAENVDSERSKLLEIERDQKRGTSELERTEDRLSQAKDQQEQKAIADDIERQKANIAALKIEEGGRAAALQQLEQRLQSAHDNLEDTQRELNEIIARLRPGSK